MKFTVSETAKLTGVSIRTLHYYHEINLLTPSEIISNTGYRYYDEKDIERLQQILFYRELDFSLKDIVKIMNDANYSKEQALRNQRELLILKKSRINKLISLLDSNLKGENTMSFNEFDMTEIENTKKKYEKEVKEKWGSSNEYKECNQKHKNYSKEDWEQVMKESDDIFRRFAKQRGNAPESQGVQELVEEWKEHITKHHYNCTKEIFANLGLMYTEDSRFAENINKFGEGTAELISKGIEIYCAK